MKDNNLEDEEVKITESLISSLILYFFIKGYSVDELERTFDFLQIPKDIINNVLNDEYKEMNHEGEN